MKKKSGINGLPETINTGEFLFCRNLCLIDKDIHKPEQNRHQQYHCNLPDPLQLKSWGQANGVTDPNMSLLTY